MDRAHGGGADASVLSATGTDERAGLAGGVFEPASRKLEIIEPSRREAHRLAATLEELVQPAPLAVTLFEHGEAWRIEAYYEPMPDGAALIAAAEELSGLQVSNWRVVDVPQENWVAISQAALPPVRIGRFTIHGSHDRHRIPRGPLALEIEAGEAFGTAHHATTQGCLAALSTLKGTINARTILDLGCGSGVLAIAAARLWPRARVLAADIDPRSVEVARENVLKNGAAASVRVVLASDLERGPVGAAIPYDVIAANILAKPLIELAPQIAQATRRGGVIVLSGLLVSQAREVVAAYLASGCHVQSQWRRDGWAALVLRRR